MLTMFMFVSCYALQILITHGKSGVLQIELTPQLCTNKIITLNKISHVKRSERLDVIPFLL